MEFHVIPARHARGQVFPQVALKGLEKYCQMVKCIHRWDLGGTETRSLSHCENRLRSNPLAGSLLVAVTAGSGPW